MSQNQNPLQRRLVHLDLRKGLDERGRPETMDAAVSLTRLENLICDQEGSWIKRPGLQRLGGSNLDDLGNNVPDCIKPVRTSGGLGVLALGTSTGIHGTSESNVSLYRFMESRQRLRKSSSFSEMSVDGAFIANSQNLALTRDNTGPRVFAVAGSTVYDVVVYESGVIAGTTNAPAIIVVYERESGSEVARYALSSTSTPPLGVKIAFVNDRYFHCYFIDGAFGCKLIAVDTNSGWPATLPATTVAVTGASTPLSDICTTDTNSYVVAAGSIYYCTAAGAFTGSTAVPSVTTDTVALTMDITSAGLIYIVGLDTATSRLKVCTFNTSTLAMNTLFLDPSLPASGTLSMSVSDNGGIMLCSSNSFTFSTGTTVPYNTYYFTVDSTSTSFTSSHRVNCWVPMSAPFYCRYTGKHYQHLVKYDGITTMLGTHIIACLSDRQNIEGTAGGASSTYSVFRVAAVLENSNGYQMRLPPAIAINQGSTVAHVLHRIIRRGSDASATTPPRYPACVPYRQAANGMSVATYDLKFMDLKCGTTQNLGRLSYMSGGFLQMYDGYKVMEQGFVDQPFATALDSGVAGLVTGLVKYAFVFRSVDATGAVAYSKVYAPVSLTVSSKQVTLTVSAPHMSSRETGIVGDQQTTVEVYRTISGGSTYYYVGDAKQPGGVLTGIFSLTDNSADSTIASNRVMFRQPGSNNSPLDRYMAPGGKGILCQHKDRIFVADPYGQRVWYSAFTVDGESAWFNPAFSFFVSGGSGPITGMASMDGRLIIFKKDAVFVVDGDGPPEGGGNGSEFTPPNRLAVEFGCVDHRSIVNTPMGVFYRSTMGIELLSRSLERNWVGQLVQNTVDANLVTLGACLDSWGIVHFLLTTQDTITTGNSVCELMYDLSIKGWSKIPHNVLDLTGIGTYDDTGVEKVCYTAVGGSMVSDYTTSVDLNMGHGQTVTYPSMCLESAWIHINGPQGRQRIHDFFFLAKKAADANHALKVSVAYNYVDSYTQTKTWEPGTINGLGIEQLNLNPNKQEVIAIRFKVEDQTPADTVTYPVGTAKGCAVLSMAVDVAPKTGGSKLADAQKG